ncbi:MAG: Asp-tRNA(Asn)/Glu-tRNA(Gln) amidotransferase subunit GatC [Fusobacteriaceae bacterium]
MSLTREEIIKIGKLAKLEIKENEIEKYQKDLNDIFKYLEELNSANVENIEPLTQMNTEIKNFRSDIPKKSLTQDEATKNFPLKADGMLVVPKIVGGEE